MELKRTHSPDWENWHVDDIGLNEAIDTLDAVLKKAVKEHVDLVCADPTVFLHGPDTILFGFDSGLEFELSVTALFESYIEDQWGDEKAAASFLRELADRIEAKAR